MKQKRSENRHSRVLLKQVLVGLVVFLGLICLYYGSTFAPHSPRIVGESSPDDGVDPVFESFVLKEDGFSNKLEVQELDSQIPRSIPICDIRYSELIPCLDRHLIYQLKLKPNLTLMEHYERHCPPPEQRYNCLIPPPIVTRYQLDGQQVEMQFGKQMYHIHTLQTRSLTSIGWL
ncbi:hypothetical protein Ancab_026963 [Ancistrocladus abbreviatus]